ncbi:UNVERIFIED_CONTAM: hypothetical protein GTU68_003701 [Idotea baltica]|nr:hypothetical protein [Idotea baltica]
MTTPVVQASGIVKRYGHVTAIDHSDFELRPGEILAVIGDNGAGKSSIVKAICGATIPDEGEIKIEGKTVNFTSPIQARDMGIEIVYQNLALSPALSIADNMFTGREIRKEGILGKFFRMLDKPAMEKFARDKLTELGLMTVQSIKQPVETLSGGQRQGVAVARAAAFATKFIIMDEPTAALGVKESRKVLELMKDVKSRGIPIVLISHNMPHVFEVADRIHIHRLGKRLCTIDPKDYTIYGKHRALQNVSVTLSKGEAVVILGANGAGKSTLLKAIAGMVTPLQGTDITMQGESLIGRPQHTIVETGIAVVPEGRGVFADLTVAENLLLGANPRRARAHEVENMEKVLNLFPRLRERRGQVVATMSGGEQQMVAIGRALMSAPEVLMLDEPSLGLAPVLVGELFESLAKVRESGVSLLIVEQNVDISLRIADRGYLLEAGLIVGQGSSDTLMHDPAVQNAFLGTAT